MRGLALLLLYYGFCGFVAAGWLLFGPPTTPALAFTPAERLTVVVACAALGLAPLLALWLRERIWVPARWGALALLVAYEVSAAHYYFTQEHRFDPFLQMPSATLPATVARPQHVYRVLALGGSTTRSESLPEEARYPTLLARRLQAASGSARVEVLNFGMDWYTSKHSLINYVTYAHEWAPDVVVVLQGINDIARSFAPPELALGAYDDQYTHFYGPAIHGARPPAFGQYLFGGLLRKWYIRVRLQPAELPLDAYPSIRPFEANLRRLVGAIRGDGADVVLVTQPTLLHAGMSDAERERLWLGKVFCRDARSYWRQSYAAPQSLRVALEAFNDVTRRLAASEGVTLADAARLVPAGTANFADEVHFTSAGAQLVAEVVATAMLDAQLIPRRLSARTPPS